MQEQQLLAILRGLTKRSLSSAVLSLAEFLARLLAEEEEFFKLRCLYEEWVLPELARRAKGCRKPRSQQTVLRICQFYTVGFLHHCQLGPVGLDCLLTGIEQVQDPQVRSEWTALCELVVDKEDGIRKQFRSWLDSGNQKPEEKAKTQIFSQFEVF